MQFIGTIAGTKGLKGRMILSDTTADIAGLQPESIVKIGFSENFAKEYTATDYAANAKNAEIQLKEITSKETAGTLKDRGVFTDSQNIIAKSSSSYLVSDIVGCKAIDYITKEIVGEFVDVWLLPAQDVWVIKTASQEIPVPYHDEFIKKIDLKKRIIEIKFIEGMSEINTGEVDE
ncbi:MAG: ribosome maturation factor RimM [Bacteroidota bacterium]|jgi:16S rRNA processing protein RimM